MSIVSTLIDYFLYALVAATLGLLAWKTLELHLPWWRGGRAVELLGTTEAALQEKLEHLERGMAVLAVIASAAPFVGLAGTVIHIVEALRQLGTGMADMSLVGGPIATALTTTLVGLFSAVPAVIGHTLLSRRIELLESRHRRFLAARLESSQ